MVKTTFCLSSLKYIAIKEAKFLQTKPWSVTFNFKDTKYDLFRVVYIWVNLNSIKVYKIIDVKSSSIIQWILTEQISQITIQNIITCNYCLWPCMLLFFPLTSSLCVAHQIKIYLLASSIMGWAYNKPSNSIILTFLCNV